MIVIMTTILVFIIIFVAILQIFFSNIRTSAKVTILYDQTFICPDFISDGYVIEEDALRLYTSALTNIANWCYVGSLYGTCSFDNKNYIENKGKEIIKSVDGDYYSFCQTSSIGEIPLIGNSSINSAKKYYVNNNKLYFCEANEDERFIADSNLIDWNGLQYKEKTDDAEKIVSSIKNAIPFIVTADRIMNLENTKVYICNNCYYMSFEVNVAAFTLQELLAILDGKLSTSVIEFADSIISLTNASVDMSKMEATMDVEMIKIDDIYYITGRIFRVFGQIMVKAFVSLDMSMDLSMPAVVLYDKEHYNINEEDLLFQNFDREQ